MQDRRQKTVDQNATRNLIALGRDNAFPVSSPTLAVVGLSVGRLLHRRLKSIADMRADIERLVQRKYVLACTVSGCWLAGTSLVFSKSGIIPNMRLGGGASCVSDDSPRSLFAPASFDPAPELGDPFGLGPVAEALCAGRTPTPPQNIKPSQQTRLRIRFMLTILSSLLRPGMAARIRLHSRPRTGNPHELVTRVTIPTTSIHPLATT